MESAIQIHPHDSVAIAVRDLAAGEKLRFGDVEVTVQEAIGAGHKVAIRETAKDSQVIRYGQPIGAALGDIASGQWVHSHNLKNRDSEQAYQFATEIPSPPNRIERTFQGYRRQNGSAGTRNYLAIISNVNCSASVSRQVARHFTAERLAAYPNVDGVVAFTHHGGCAMQFGGQQHQLLNRVMGGIARHPNIGGYVLIGLGCEQATLDYLMSDQHLVQIEGTNQNSADSIPVMTMQQNGGTQKTIQHAIRSVEAL
ncbi:MAG: UxaA family hydrolase, partial [Planctomycetales bacterium]|nr:UxaA family hydrolase [Planctomycetales bacterium]